MLISSFFTKKCDVNRFDVDFFDLKINVIFSLGFSKMQFYFRFHCSAVITALCVYFRLNTSECFTLGDVTTVNMTMVKGGVAYNVIPADMDVSFDLRIPPTVNLQVCTRLYEGVCASLCS